MFAAVNVRVPPPSLTSLVEPWMIELIVRVFWALKTTSSPRPLVMTPRRAGVPIVEALLSLLRSRPPNSRLRTSLAAANSMLWVKALAILSIPVVAPPEGSVWVRLAVAVSCVTLPAPKSAS